MSDEAKIALTAEEVGILIASLRRTNLEINPITWIPTERRFNNQESSVAISTFNELKKWLDDEKRVTKDCEVVLDSSQKSLLIDCIESMEWGINDLENKANVIEKLSK